MKKATKKKVTKKPKTIKLELALTPETARQLKHLTFSMNEDCGDHQWSTKQTALYLLINGLSEFCESYRPKGLLG